MTQIQIAVVVGSLRRDSFNRRLADAVARLAPPDFVFRHLSIGDLPLYNQDDDTAPAAAVTRLKAEITAAHGLLFVTAEYNRSIPGVLKNAIDHASRPHGQSAWAGKRAGIIGASPGASGTALAQQHLRNVLAALDVMTLALPEIFFRVTEHSFEVDGNAGTAQRALLQQWVDRYVSWIRRHAA